MSTGAPVTFSQMARGGLQRYIVPAVLLLIVFILLQQNFGSLAFSGYFEDSATSSSNIHFKWSEIPVLNPVSKPIPLPDELPYTLPKVQHTFETESAAEEDVRLTRQKAVKDALLKVWGSYRRKAWLKDELTPLSGSYLNTFGGWAATLVDTLDTLWIMGLQKEFNEAVDALHKIDFTKPEEEVLNVFETTIRYLGGFLSAYDLSGNPKLLEKATEVGEMLLVAFDTPNRMPVTRWDWRSAVTGLPQQASDHTLVAEIGSLTLEFTRLSQITKDGRWYDAVERITQIMSAQQNETFLPGMYPVVVNARTAQFTGDTSFTLGGMADSLYEYFPKQFALLGGLAPVYRDLYTGSMDTAIKHLFFRPMLPDEADVLISGSVRSYDREISPKLDPQGQHLTCFTGGMLALGGRLFEIPEHVELGRKLTDGCIWAYKHSRLGIMPELFRMIPCESKDACPWSQKKWEEVIAKKWPVDEGKGIETSIERSHCPPGFVEVPDRRYILRPEAIESVFMLYRITGDRSLQDAAWEMFQNIEKHTKTDLANAALDDVTIDVPVKSDRMESFWTAETLKYFYLIFSEPDLISLDEFVFNTEAHPFLRPK